MVSVFLLDKACLVGVQDKDAQKHLEEFAKMASSVAMIRWGMLRRQMKIQLLTPPPPVCLRTRVGEELEEIGCNEGRVIGSNCKSTGCRRRRRTL